MEQKQITNLGGGMRQDLAMLEMSDNQFLRLRNMEYDVNGILSKRAGSALFNASALPGICDNAIRYHRMPVGRYTEAWMTFVSVFVAGTPNITKVYVSVDNLGTFVEITGDVLSLWYPVSFIAFRGYVLLTNGVEDVMYISGTTKQACSYNTTSGHVARNGKYISQAANRIFLANDSLNGANLIYFSEDGFWPIDPSANCDFPVDNVFELRGDSGDEILALFPFGDYLYAMRNRNAYRISGAESPTTISQQEILTNVGIANPKAYCITTHGIIFASSHDNTIYWWNPNEGTLIDIGQWHCDTINEGTLENAVCGWYPKKKQAYVSFQSSDTSPWNDISIVYDLKDVTSGVIKGTESTQAGRAFVACDTQDDNGKFYSLSADTSGALMGAMIQQDAGTQDLGANFGYEIWMRHNDLGNKDIIKRLRRLRIESYSEELTTPIDITVNIDRGAYQKSVGAYTTNATGQWGTFLYGDIPYGGNGYQSFVVAVPIEAQGKLIQLRFSKTSADTFKLFSYTMDYIPRGLRGR